MGRIAIGIVGVLLVLGLILTLGGFTTVEAGSRAVVTRNGTVVRVLDSGLHGLTPFIEESHVIDVRTQKEQAEAQAASQDLQSVDATVAVNYNVDPDKVADLYTRVGLDYKAKIIDPAIQEAVKSATALYSASDLQAKRPLVADAVKATLIERMAPYDLNVTDVSIVNFKYSDAFNNAIEQKASAQQQAQTAEFNYEAAQKDALAIKVKSEAANNEKYVQLQQLEVEKAAVDKWDGKLPVQMIPGSTLPFINLTSTP